ncbi:response regulator [Mycobacterium sp.]|jgi:CheY-like chemotaxis protein|uniref:response regulator n=1 Tax=Mycobacterium sp. TaxID=1785 RepID=UPI002C5D5F6E|nr:response regulator [Mycobacterium sp.]HTH89336.1 response regulator [Mycobacterium sp.]
MRCLIVDDSADFRDAASAMLERAGISVVGKASNSAEALRYYEDLHPDVALVDIDLGGEDGFALAELLDRVSATSTTLAVILVSTYAESDLEEMINASPAVGFLQKFSLSPDAIRELAERHRASR